MKATADATAARVAALQTTHLSAALERAAERETGLAVHARDGSAERQSYAQLLEGAQKLAQKLIALGLQPGDRAALILGVSLDLPRLLFACASIGVVPFCLPTPRLGRSGDYRASIEAMLRAASARLVVCETGAARQLAGTVEAVGTGLGLRTPQELASINPAVDRFDAPASHDPALIQFSSGTTVAPKPVCLTHGNLSANISAILASLPGDLREHSCCSWLPLHHDMGLIGGMLSAVFAGGEANFLRPEDFVARPGLWLKTLANSGATISPAPNFALQMCLDRIRDEELERLDLSRWSAALIGAEMVRETTLQRFTDRFAKCGFRNAAFTPVYGLAEATLAVTFSDPLAEPRAASFDRRELGEGRVLRVDPPAAQSDADALRLLGVGRPLHNVALEIRDPGGNALPEERLGRIFVRGPAVMAGYLDQPEATARTLSKDGWLDTGDLGFLHQGDLFIFGREKDILIINGRNHDPASVEFALAQGETPGLSRERAAAFAVDPDPQTGAATEGFALLIEKERGPLPADRSADDLARAAREAVIVATGLIAEEIGVVEFGRLPRTTSGKIRRGEARRMHLAGEFELLGRSLR